MSTSLWLPTYIINVKIVDVDLSAVEAFSGSFSLGINDVRVQGLESGGNVNAASIRLDPGFDNAFSAVLEAQITNDNAKILTDPTLIVQGAKSDSRAHRKIARYRADRCRLGWLT